MGTKCLLYWVQEHGGLKLQQKPYCSRIPTVERTHMATNPRLYQRAM